MVGMGTSSSPWGSVFENVPLLTSFVPHKEVAGSGHPEALCLQLGEGGEIGLLGKPWKSVSLVGLLFILLS